MIVTGDPSQVDLPNGQTSGLQEAVRLLAGVEGSQHPHEGDGDLRRVPVAVRVGGHAEHDSRQPGKRLEGDAVRTAPQEPPDDEDDERGERDLDGVGEEAEPADAVANADEDELERPNLQRRIGEGVGPPHGKERPRGVREIRQVGWVARPERRHERGRAERNEPGEEPEALAHVPTGSASAV